VWRQGIGTILEQKETLEGLLEQVNPY